VPGTFWIPNAAFLEELVSFLAGKVVLEVFAGNGYLAGLLRAQGIEVTPTSLLSSHDGHESGLYAPVEEMKASDAVACYGGTHDVLLMTWPVVTLDVLRACEAWGPSRPIVFVGEVTDYEKNHLGGCATDEFFEAIQVTRRFESYKGNMLEAAFVCDLVG
jgi:hypothetical protein